MDFETVTPVDFGASLRGLGLNMLVQAARNRPHGLRKAYILCEDGYAWVPSRPLSMDERAALD
ncbi:hypothetical protein [Roseovarius amoyensis]|uniref:hypothetical protein n=1 Tax=Roseovarius amoyensis TaxID=2211448 RepID=UPI000DBE8D48|nr:hypothetical protein [Roseovarius amoyensis]